MCIRDRDKTLREIVQVTKAIDALREHDLLTNDPEQHKPAKKAKPDLGTSVATKPDDSHTKPTTVSATHDEWTYPNEFPASPQPTDAELDADAYLDERDAVEKTWRTRAFKAMHKALHDVGYGFPSVAKRTLAAQLMQERLNDQATWDFLCELWGWRPFPLSRPSLQVEEVIEEMTDDAIEILLTQLAVIRDLEPSGLEQHVDYPEDLTLTMVCSDDDINVDWQTMRYQAMHPELSESDLPHVSPPAATGDIGAPANGGDKSPQEDKEQAPQGAQSQEGSIQLAHWVGQKVKVRTTKRVGEVSEVRGDGTLVVAVPNAAQEGVSDLKFCTTHDLQVLPGQFQPTGVTA